MPKVLEDSSILLRSLQQQSTASEAVVLGAGSRRLRAGSPMMGSDVDQSVMDGLIEIKSLEAESQKG